MARQKRLMKSDTTPARATRSRTRGEREPDALPHGSTSWWLPARLTEMPL
jgi:hypothetical protein